MLQGCNAEVVESPLGHQSWWCSTGRIDAVTVQRVELRRTVGTRPAP
jgi:hypothetical protein